MKVKDKISLKEKKKIQKEKDFKEYVRKLKKSLQEKITLVFN